MSTDLRGGDSTATVYVALAEGKVQSNVGGGENGGRSLTHMAVVRVLAPMGTRKGGTRCQKTSSCRSRRPIAFVSLSFYRTSGRIRLSARHKRRFRSIKNRKVDNVTCPASKATCRDQPSGAVRTDNQVRHTRAACIFQQPNCDPR